jgi:hypothetical protein
MLVETGGMPQGLKAPHLYWLWTARLEAVPFPTHSREQGEISGSRTCKPNSVRGIALAGRPFLWAAHCYAALATYPKVGRTEPARVRSKLRTPSLFGLAPCGVCPARDITAAAVRSYRTFSPLPRVVKRKAVCFLWHFPSVRLESDVPDVIRHTALRSSDFPLPAPESAESDRPVRLPT